jgi:mRNA interferase MazF
MRRGDVIIVDYPFSDATGRKVRPALVVQADEFNRRLDDTILALITSSRARFTGSPTQLPIDITTRDGRESGLRLSSVVQCENLVTIDKSFVVHTIGRFSAALVQQIDGCLKAALGIRT